MVLSDPIPGRIQLLHVFDTECRAGLKPVQTSFIFQPTPSGSWICLLSEPCSHAPSPDELIAAPFYPDPSQRIVALTLDGVKWFTINTGVSLELGQKWRDRCVEWCEWNKIIDVQVGEISRCDYPRVSRCRLFCVVPGSTDREIYYLQVYDFSRGSRTKNLDLPDGLNEGGGERESQTPSEVGLSRLPWNTRDLLLDTTSTVGHDSFVLFIVSNPAILPTCPQVNIICLLLLQG